MCWSFDSSSIRLKPDNLEAEIDLLINVVCQNIILQNHSHVTAVIIRKGKIKKFYHRGWKLLIFEWFKFGNFWKKSSYLFAFREEKLSTLTSKNKVADEKKWQIWNIQRHESFHCGCSSFSIRTFSIIIAVINDFLESL